MKDQTKDSRPTTIPAAMLFVRIALAAAFLSAVADRLGLWGPPGSPGVAWGNVKSYEDYVALLNWFLPAALIPVVGWIATIAEIAIAIGLLVGWRLRVFSLAAGLLLTLFAAAMFAALGPKPPLDYSVLTAAGAAYLLSAVSTSRQQKERNQPGRNKQAASSGE